MNGTLKMKCFKESNVRTDKYQRKSFLTISLRKILDLPTKYIHLLLNRFYRLSRRRVIRGKQRKKGKTGAAVRAQRNWLHFERKKLSIRSIQHIRRSKAWRYRFWHFSCRRINLGSWIANRLRTEMESSSQGSLSLTMSTVREKSMANRTDRDGKW